ncbi:MAG: 2-oxo acid dehydrogenase subunit E2, partial [Myxococcales bacterium]|nr:2-oxo acid dehydrogenase subunit E2 [Myxococcales bacterium]
GRALAHAIERVPEINVRLLRGYAVPRATIDIFFISAVEGGRDLSGVRIDRANEKSLVAIAGELRERARSQKEGRDPELARAKRSMQVLPKSVLQAALRFSAFLASDLDLGLRGLGLTPSPFGSAMVSSVGMFGLPTGFAPISWMYRVPILVLVGEMGEKPAIVDGNVVARTILPISATIDHRYVDGWHVAKLLDGFKEYLADPGLFE